MKGRGKQLNETEQKTADLQVKAEIFQNNVSELRKLTEERNNSFTIRGWGMLFGTSKKDKATRESVTKNNSSVQSSVEQSENSKRSWFRASKKSEPTQAAAEEVTTGKGTDGEEAPAAIQQDKTADTNSKLLSLKLMITSKVAQKVQEAEKQVPKLSEEESKGQIAMFSKSAASSTKQTAAPESKPTSVVGKIMAAASRVGAYLLKLLHSGGMFGGKKDEGNSGLAIENPADANKQGSKHLKGSGGLMACFSRLCHSNKNVKAKGKSRNLVK